MRYRPEIDGLRTLAVLPVVLYHAGMNFFSGGFVGVDIFFVISGFLITSILINDLRAGKFSLATFYERRCRRILPPLTVVALVVTVLGWLYLMPDDFRSFGRSMAAMATFWVNLVFYREVGYFNPVAESKPLLHTWSLSVEEQFYIIFPLLLALIFKKCRRFVPVILIVIAGVSLVASVIYINYNSDAVFYLLHFRAWELMLGAIIAVIPTSPALGRVPVTFLSLLGLTGIIYPVMFYTSKTLFPGLAALPPCLGTALLIYIHGRGLGNSPVGRLLALPPMTGIGKISYSLYLWHWPILALGAYVADRALSSWELALAVAASFIMATLSYYFVEQPVRKRKVLAKRRNLFIVSIMVILSMVVVGRVIRSTEGFPNRLPADILKYAEFRSDMDTETADKYCYTAFGPHKKPLPTPCEVGPASGVPAKFILWGDSYSQMWKPAIDILTREYNMAGFYGGAAGCNPFYNAALAPGQRPPFAQEQCFDFNESVFEFVKDKGLKHVIIGTNYTAWVREEMELKASGKAAPGPGGFSTSIKNTVKRLNSDGVEVWIIETVPSFGSPVPGKIAKAMLKGGSMADMVQDASIYIRQADHVRKIVDDLRAEGFKINFLENNAAICPDGRCWPGDENGAFYYDTNHLSTYGAGLFKDCLKPVFEALAGLQTAPEPETIDGPAMAPVEQKADL